MNQLIFVILVLGVSTGARAANTCSPEELRQRCQAIAADLRDENMRAATRAQSSSKLELGDSYRFSEGVKDAKKAIVAEILRGRDPKDLTPTERDFVKKIETVTYIPPDHSLVTGGSDCPANSPNAFYSALNHSITICPGLVVQSDAALAYSIAHELSHAVDPCNIDRSVYTVRLSDLALARKNQSVISFAKKGRLDTAIKYIKASGRMTLNPDSAQNSMPDVKDITDLIPRSALTKVSGGISTDQNPFLKAYQCLAKAPFGFRAGEANACSEKSQMNEAMSDFLAAKALGRHFDRVKPRSDLERFQALGTLAAGVCEAGNGKAKAGEHASYEDRLMKIVMTEPSVRRAFDCAETSRTCFSQDGAPASSRPGPSKPAERSRRFRTVN